MGLESASVCTLTIYLTVQAHKVIRPVRANSSYPEIANPKNNLPNPHLKEVFQYDLDSLVICLIEVIFVFLFNLLRKM